MSPTAQLFCPFPFTVDTHLAKRIDAKVDLWIDRIGLFPGQAAEVSRFQLGTFATMVHPDSEDEDRLLLAAENITAGFGIDDHYCDEGIEGAISENIGIRLAGVLNALEYSSGLPDEEQIEKRILGDPVTAALREMIHHTARIASPGQLGRLRRETAAMCLAMAGEKAWEASGRTPTVSEYLAQRRFNGAISCLALIDIVGGYELPADVYDNSDVRTLTLTASSLIIHVNDLYSTAKEATTSAAAYNLPALLAKHNGWPLDRGIAETVRIHNRTMRQYLLLERKVASKAPPELARYLMGLRSWIRGSLEWHSISGRHHNRTGRPNPDTRWWQTGDDGYLGPESSNNPCGSAPRYPRAG